MLLAIMKNSEVVKTSQEKTLKLEREIKVLILLCALKLISRNVLYLKLTSLIARYNKELPITLIEREKYIQGAYSSSIELVRQVYEPIVYNFTPTKEFKTPYEFVKFTQKFMDYDLAIPTLKYYPDIVNNALRNLNRRELVYSENGKRPISLWQKAELDLRHDEQMKMLQECYKSGKDLFWLSSHKNCSKRCEPRQGKLVSLSLPAIDSSFWTGKFIDGIKIYSFNAIENQIDQYGYKNNIINGFNCRHHLIEYVKGGKKPKEFYSYEIDKTRNLEKTQREMERAIRRKKTEVLNVELVDKKKAYNLNKQINLLLRQYKAFCNKNGLNIDTYRIF